MNWNPELLQYRKSFFDIWKGAEMLQSNSLSLKENPQYCLDFIADAAQGQVIGHTFVCWVVVSKLQMMGSDGKQEDEESHKDYIAMHMYNNSNKGQKVLEDQHCIKRSIYSPS